MEMEDAHEFENLCAKLSRINFFYPMEKKKHLSNKFQHAHLKSCDFLF